MIFISRLQSTGMTHRKCSLTAGEADSCRCGLANQFPEWWDRVGKERPCVYVTLGSSGNVDLVPTVLEALGSLDDRPAFTNVSDSSHDGSSMRFGGASPLAAKSSTNGDPRFIGSSFGGRSAATSSTRPSG
jgi:hypothetical protein